MAEDRLSRELRIRKADWLGEDLARTGRIPEDAPQYAEWEKSWHKSLTIRDEAVHRIHDTLVAYQEELQARDVPAFNGHDLTRICADLPAEMGRSGAEAQAQVTHKLSIAPAETCRPCLAKEHLVERQARRPGQWRRRVGDVHLIYRVSVERLTADAMVIGPRGDIC